MRLTALLACLMTTMSCSVGCRDEASEMQRIMRQRQIAVQKSTQQDHLGEAVELLNDYVELNEQKASQQIVYHVNQWLRENGDRVKPEGDDVTTGQPPVSGIPAIAKSLDNMIAPDVLTDAITRPRFTLADVPLLRDANTFRHVAAWINTALRDDPLFADWLIKLRAGATDAVPSSGQSNAEQGTAETPLSTLEIDRLQTAMRFFDWTIRNIALEPDQLAAPPQIQPPSMPPGIPFEGPGVRQTDYQTIWRGRGDWLQRCGVFTQLCLQAGIPTAVLATQSDETGGRTPWAVGVLIGDQMFLFEPRLGLPIPGPDQTGIATLSQARKDPTVMRRLDVAGYFEYPLTRLDIQQSVALLNLRAETLSPRMRLLESGLTGNRRMTLWVNADDWAEKIDAVPGIAGVHIWEMPTLAEVYAQIMEMISARDPAFAFWYRSRYAVLEPGASSDNNLAKGRWKHLIGQFADDEMEDDLGARTRYLNQRAPEYEIEDLRINVELQIQYGLRRELGVAPERYDQQLREMQKFMRMGKRTATYWLALVQYDDGRFETAYNWFTKRVLDQQQQSHWKDAAVYNAARASEAMGDIDLAIETLKTDGSVSDYGNRLRARLIDKNRPTKQSG